MLSSKLNHTGASGRPAGGCCRRCAPPPPPLTLMTPSVARVPSRDSCMGSSRAAAQAASANSQGPAGPSRPERKRKPEWVRCGPHEAARALGFCMETAFGGHAGCMRLMKQRAVTSWEGMLPPWWLAR
eukprot:360578-Chlamydomonas_euryale.AAC.4